MNQTNHYLKENKVIGLMKDKLSKRMMTEFAALRAKIYTYVTDSNDEDKKAKGTRTCFITRKPKFEDY